MKSILMKNRKSKWKNRKNYREQKMKKKKG